MTVEIQLTQGKVALVDDIDADVAKFNWYTHRIGNLFVKFYAERKYESIDGERKYCSMHHQIFEKILGRSLEEGEQVDHINRDWLDNRRDNLRIASNVENLAYQRKTIIRSSQYRGGFWNKDRQKWFAQMILDGERNFLGYFDSKIEAAKAFDRFASTCFDEYEGLNFPVSNYINQDEGKEFGI